MKILIVDDEVVSRKKAQKILSQFGECDLAVSGKEAIDAFKRSHKQEYPYDLIIMDVLLPDMDGIETLKNMREWEESELKIPFVKGVKVLMVTATGLANVIPSFYEGCQGYIVKPFTKEKLVDAINNVGFDLKDLFQNKQL